MRVQTQGVEPIPFGLPISDFRLPISPSLLLLFFSCFSVLYLVPGPRQPDPAGKILRCFADNRSVGGTTIPEQGEQENEQETD